MKLYNTGWRKVLSRDKRDNIKYLLAWLLSMVAFVLCELFIDEEQCHSVWIPLDDVFIFSEIFVIFYVLWYFLILGSLIWLFLYNSRGFGDLVKYMTVCQLVAVVIFMVFPNKQDLRPDVIQGDNILSRLVFIIHSVDTNTNVCPSLHVCYSFALVSVWIREGRHLSTKIMYVTFSILISLSTVMIKQHSVFDFLVAMPVCLFAELVTYYKYKGRNDPVLNLKNDGDAIFDEKV